MAIGRLDHYTINVRDVDASVAFYTDALGLAKGERPPFDFPGAWLYCGERPVVHLIGGKAGGGPGTGSLDHVAFQASDLAEFTARLGALEVPFDERNVPDSELHQVFVEDPDGITIEINFLGEAQAG